MQSMKQSDWLFACLVCLVSASFLACDNAFSPSGKFEDRPVVYALLSTLSDTQFVRIYRTYNPDSFRPEEYTVDHQVVGAQVRVSDGTTTFSYRDTVIARLDRSRYTSDIHAYVARPFSVQRGRTYALNIVLPTGEEVSATTTVPGEGILRLDNTVGVHNPFVFHDPLEVLVFLANNIYGYLVRMFIEYEVDGVAGSLREEVPLSVSTMVNCTTFVASYPRPQRARARQPERVSFSNTNYLLTIQKIRGSHPADAVRTKRVIVELTALDRGLYNYYSIVHGFQDAFSIRSDEPDFSNIRGGLGVFGSMSRQSMTITVSDTLGRRFGCR
jgi:hypothetical protein